MIRKLLKTITNRGVIVTILIALQVIWILAIFLRFASYSRYIDTALKILSLFVVIYVINREDNSAMKIAWIVLILLAPLFGGMLYLYIGDKKLMTPLRKKLMPMLEESAQYLAGDPSIQERLKKEDPLVASQIYYLEKQSGYPAYEDSEVIYYPSGEECFPEMIKCLNKAKKYIFLEYFIIEPGIMWNSIVEILEQKVKEGVDVRLIYDDVGNNFTLPRDYDARLRKNGIKTIIFNRYIPIFSTVFNNRDHRKIMVIDGKVAFTGGINLADEYINEKQRFGYWKDNGIKVMGKAVYSMTIMFLQMWNAFSGDKLNYSDFSLPQESAPGKKGVILPYSDHPLDSEFVGENVYLNLVNTARDYVYFFTPYLIIDSEMTRALTLAAKKGVDVKIITPGIPDKKLVFLVTQSYYPELVKAGVSIYQYRPGFVHSKCAVSDDKIATVGTINLDYRSLYLHFENGVFLYDCDTVLDIKKDMEETLKDCTKITLAMCQKRFITRIMQAIMRVFSPLL